MNDQQLAAERTVLTDDQLWDIRNRVAIEEVTREDDSKTICVKHGRAIETAILAALAQREPVAEGEVARFYPYAEKYLIAGYGPTHRGLMRPSNVGDWVKFSDWQRTEAARLEAEKSTKFTQEWYAVRLARLEVLGKELGCWDRMAAIIANGTETSNDPLNYARMLNIAKFRADDAEAQLTAERARSEKLVKDLRRASNAMASVTIFVNSREKCKQPEGREWWEQEIQSAISAYQSSKENDNADK